MTWRFADLPVRTKFLVTLGIPVIGIVLLIGKQVDSSLKRNKVYNYIKERSELIGLYSNVIHELQRESAHAVGYLTDVSVKPFALQLQFERTDASIASLHDPVFSSALPLEGDRTFNGLDVLRERVMGREVSARSISRAYRAMDHQMLDELGRVGRLALDPFTKDRLYAHLRLLHAKEALSVVRNMLAIGFTDQHLDARELGELGEQVSHYETNMLLFERDATPEVLSNYRSVFQGADVNFMRSIIGTVKERRQSNAAGIAGAQWWVLSIGALEKLKQVEEHSLAYIEAATAANSRDARLRLLIVLAAMVSVVGAVGVMGFMIMRGVRNTVNEVTHAAQSLAVGDISAGVPVNSRDEMGQMALSFNVMMENIRSLASSAEAIGKGNYDTPVNVRGGKDVLGLALSRMKENLKAARLRDDEQTLALQAEKDKLEQANARIHVLIKEMHHRVKNNLQVIASLLRLQAGTIADERLQQAFDQSQSRVTSMALIHEKLYKGDELSKVDVAMYIQELFAELVGVNDVGDRIRCSTDVDPDLALDLHTMVPLGLLLNELITNSFKHAFTGRQSGLITLALHRADGVGLDLVYQDDGVGIPVEKLQDEGTTLGMSLIESLVDQLNGHMTVQGDTTGTKYHIRFGKRSQVDP